ncbi:hypothetical protein BH10PSE13_BH10PSE13_07230 [soil metagenome]
MTALCVAVKARRLPPGWHWRYRIAMTNPPDPKKERLAAALRANLRRRKMQEREQAAGSTEGMEQPGES